MSALALNNPFNIRFSSRNNWKGQYHTAVNGFCQFKNVDYGLRAGLILLRNYVRKGYDTPRLIIQRFAPSSENPTWNYIAYVCSQSGIEEGDKIRDLEDLCRLAVPMLYFESKYEGHRWQELLSLCILFNIKM